MRLDDDKYLDTSSHSIGEIKLVISRTTAPKILTKKQPECTYFVPPQLQKVHERSKKAIAHRVGYVASLTLYSTWHLIKANNQLW